MLVIAARNANQALPEILHQFKNNPLAVKRDSRNGKVTQFCEPCTIHYYKPAERVVFWPERDANPFFHLFESLWMLAGRNDVAFPSRFAANIKQYSDDGVTFHGAYGYRWRKHFGSDQLAPIAAALKKNPEDRRQVLSMWDANSDLGREGKDLPCNLQAVFQRDHNGRLNMTVYNRSNDSVWGALGANCVHFSYLQEFLAAWIGCEVGQYWQVSANMHLYDFNSAGVVPLADKAFPSRQVREQCYYEQGAQTYPLVSTNIETWQSDLHMFLSEGGRAMGYRDHFFRRVAVPMDNAYAEFKNKGNPNRFSDALSCLNQMASCDWKLAAAEWLIRRMEKATAKAKAAQPEE